jgi:hypothetical protein
MGAEVIIVGAWEVYLIKEGLINRVIIVISKNIILA